ncbi:hypothetical protein DEALK_01960 [Dehalogenimonas alkenigignens]|uniref:Uncharacterized protein n=1 Tax=Dehalogenimonas alkenigignens TaxID=1217799 RepID=A0A0W0GL71_9CHLR|nr:hypothetical protein DEALK_01960 [Dehalogenimonas alkenigignens]
MVGRYRFFHLFGVYEAVLIDRHQGDVEAMFGQVLAALDDGMMFDGGSDDVVALFSLGPGRAFERPVVGLGAAAGEIDLVGAGTDERSYFAAGLFNCRAGCLSR